MADADTPLTRRPPEERDRLATLIADRLDTPLTVLGVLFALLVLAETVSRPTGRVSTAFQVAGWVLWAVFVAEFVLRLVIAPSTTTFLRKNWWQLIFLAVPFLRFLRVARLGRLVRAGRVGRIASAAVRGTRTAARRLGGRLAWLGAVTAIVILAASQILFEVGAYDSYPAALRAATLAAVAGEPLLGVEGPVQLLEVALVLFSVVVFATLAGSLGAFFLEREGPGPPPEPGLAPGTTAPGASAASGLSGP